MGCKGEKNCARIGHNIHQDRLSRVGIRGMAWLMPSRPEMELESVLIPVSVCWQFKSRAPVCQMEIERIESHGLRWYAQPAGCRKGGIDFRAPLI